MWRRTLIYLATAIGTVVVAVAWWAGAGWLGIVTTPHCKPAGPGVLVVGLWAFFSFLVFLLAVGGLAALWGSGSERGRRARWITAVVCIVLAALVTWGDVEVTQDVARNVDCGSVPYQG